jgi:hypothetical protein
MRPTRISENLMYSSRTNARIAASIAALTLVALVAACSDGTGPATPTAADAARLNADVAATTGAGIASDVAVWGSNEAAVSDAFARAGAPSAGTCTRSGNVTTCTGGRDGTLEITRTVAFFDAAGAAQQAYDASTTARIDFAVQVSGTTSGDRFTSTVNRSRAQSVTGLAGAETQRTWNGTGSGTTTNTFTGAAGSRTVTAVETDTTTNVVWVVAPTRAPYPASGTVVRRMNVTTTLVGDRSATYTAARRVQVTFNGTAQVPLEVSTVTPRGTTRALSCQLDLSTRAVTCTE